ncbi:MAG: zinc-dependent alcohol dehydrogenase [Aquisalimonadaceae bacterium]
MKAVCWFGTRDVRVNQVPDPELINPHDAIVKVTSTAICGSDLHLYNGYIPGMQEGDVLGHEFMGEVMEVGEEVNNLRAGDRVVVPFTISCGHCFFCKHQYWSLCDNSNPNSGLAEKLWGHSPAGLFGYSHVTGGYAGGQAEYVRVPYADVGPYKIPDGLSDEQVLFLTDIFPTGYQAAEACGIQPGDTVAVWGCGPVGQFAIASARMLGAERIIAIDDVNERLDMAVRHGKVEPLRPSEVGNTLQMMETLRDMTHGRGPDACIDAVGMEGHGVGLEGWYDTAKQAVMLETDRPVALRQAILSCRKAGTVSIPGVYAGLADKIPLGALMNKALTVKTGQTHVQRYIGPLIKRIMQDELDPSFVITHRLQLDEAPRAYDIFNTKQEGCIKVVLTP